MSVTPSMTRQHFEAIAATIKAAKPRTQSPEIYAWSEWCDVVSKFVEMCQTSNSRFDEKRFLEACGYPV